MKRIPTVTGLSLLLLTACHGKSTTATVTPAPQPQPSQIQLGDPLPDLTAEELASFERGRALFSKRFTPSQGLGPLYNAVACASCHSTPVVGGGSDLYRNFYVATWGVNPVFQFNLPGLVSQVVPNYGTPGTPTFTLEGARRTLPETLSGLTVTKAQRNSIPIFGTGLFEFISNNTILANADPDDADADGISGRTNSDGAGLGRFGTKAQSNSIEFFTRAPLFNNMGITSNPFRGAAGTISLSHGMTPQGTGTPNAPTVDADGIPDPEISHEDLGDLIAFTRFLAPPQPLPFNEAARRGETTFDAIGCASCHIPELESSRGPVRAYTDLLIHDMGPMLADGINFGSPQMSVSSPPHNASEFRTQPLWGISHFAPYLHDGRAATLDEAIRMHAGESEASRDEYVALTPVERDDLIAFLRHL